VGPGHAAAGDAAIVVDPLSALGIGYALASGAELVRGLYPPLRATDPSGLEGDAAAVSRHSASDLAYYRIERRWPDSPS